VLGLALGFVCTWALLALQEVGNRWLGNRGLKPLPSSRLQLYVDLAVILVTLALAGVTPWWVLALIPSS
jgi:hypothetical protein